MQILGRDLGQARGGEGGLGVHVHEQHPAPMLPRQGHAQGVSRRRLAHAALVIGDCECSHTLPSRCASVAMGTSVRVHVHTRTRVH